MLNQAQVTCICYFDNFSSTLTLLRVRAVIFQFAFQIKRRHPRP